MKKIYNVLFVLAVPAIFLFFTSEVMYPGGSPGGKTGSPGDEGANCTQCHSGTPMNQEFWIYNTSMLIAGYEPGGQYEMIVFGADANANRFGFEATAEDAAGNKVGTFSPGILGMTQLANNNKSVTHTLAGTTPLADTGTVWFFNWTAPPESVGEVTFYAAINAANGNNLSSGDQIHLSQFSASPAVGIFNSKAESNFRMYPNPASDIVYIESREISSNNNTLEVLNLQGQLVHKSEIINQREQINLSQLPRGIYLFKLGKQMERLVVQ